MAWLPYPYPFIHPQDLLSNDWVHGDVERETVNPDGMLFTIRKTIPYLMQLGISEQQIRAIAIENPKGFFSRTA
jgi:predicted metal-dependent phosphotriesterase family hydrolase